MEVLNSCVRLQRTVSRQPAPYGNCLDVSSIDSSKNAYADFYPVKYSPTVRVFDRISVYLIKLLA